MTSPISRASIRRGTELLSRTTSCSCPSGMMSTGPDRSGRTSKQRVMPEQLGVPQRQRGVLAEGNDRASRRGCTGWEVAQHSSRRVVREEIHHIREGKHGARSAKQAIAVRTFESAASGVKLGAPRTGLSQVRRKAQQDLGKGKSKGNVRLLQLVRKPPVERSNGRTFGRLEKKSWTPRPPAKARGPASCMRVR